MWTVGERPRLEAPVRSRDVRRRLSLDDDPRFRVWAGRSNRSRTAQRRRPRKPAKREEKREQDGRHGSESGSLSRGLARVGGAPAESGDR